MPPSQTSRRLNASERFARPSTARTMKLFAKIAALAAILLLLAGILVPTMCGPWPTHKVSMTRAEMSQAAIALQLYDMEYGHFPAETDNVLLVQVLEGDNPRKLHFYAADREESKTGQFMDGWGMPLVFKSNNTGLLIRSAGKDGRYYTEDDITEVVQVKARSAAAVSE